MRWSSHLRDLLDESRSRGWRFEPATLREAGTPDWPARGGALPPRLGPELLCGVVPCCRVRARHDAKIERSTNNLSAAKRIALGLSREGTPSDYFELRAALA
jgi:hypothetical protein